MAASSTCQMHSTVHGTFLTFSLNISSITFIHIFLQLSTYIPVPLQKNMVHEIPFREPCLELD